MRLLITGGAGFIGQRLLSKCLKDQIPYTSIDEKLLTLFILTGNYSYVTLNESVFNQEVLRNALSDSDVVVHLVGNGETQICQSDPNLSFKDNIYSLQTVLEACREQHKKIVFPSSAAVYGITEEVPVKETSPLKPNNTYAHHKVICEHLIQAYHEQYGVDYVILRLFNVYGGGAKGLFTRFIQAAKYGKEFRAFGVNQYRDFVYIDDVVNALIKAATDDRANNKILNIGSGAGIQIRDVLKMMSDIYPEVTVLEQKSTMVDYDHIADISKAKLLLGYDPVDKSKMGQILRNEVCV